MSNSKLFTCFVFFLSICFGSQVCGQSFNNPDLEGTVGYSIGEDDILPFWSNVPYTDSASHATKVSGFDSPDVLNAVGPSYDILGNPHSGNTFVSGLFMTYTDPVTNDQMTWHEGIQQTVNGYVPGMEYEVSFFQAVDKQKDALDESGSWAVYVDDELLQITIPSTSSYSPLIPTMNWEKRTVVFTATNSIHTIKFLPADDDANQEYSETDATGALRMGLDGIEVSYCDLPENNQVLGNDTGYCEPLDIVLNAGDFGTNFLWNNGDTVQELETDTSGLFWVRVEYDSGCFFTDSIRLEFYSKPKLNFTSPSAGCAPHQTSFNLLNSNDFDYWEWNFGNGYLTGESNPEVVYQASGSYDVSIMVIDTNGCENQLVKSDFVVVHDPIEARIGIGSELPIEVNEQLWLEDLSEPFSSSRWWDVGDGIMLTEAIIDLAYDDLGTHLVWLFVENEFGCADSTSILISVEGDGSLFVPSAFSPNGNGMNDVFNAKGMGLEAYLIKVYNRWGEQIFSSESILEGWDGSYMGEPVQEGVYVWLIEYKLSGEPRQIKTGRVTLLR